MNSPLPPNIVYLVSEYPAVSHTFIMREVEELRKRGFAIAVASINTPNYPSLSDKDTFYVKQQGFFKALLAATKVFIKTPLYTSRAILSIFHLAGLNVHNLLYYTAYMGEAFLLGEWMKKCGTTHLHVHFGNPAATVALFTQKLHRIRYSMTIHGSGIFYNINENLIPEKIEAASFICCIGSFTKSQLMLHSPPNHWNKIHVSPLGVDTDLFTPSSKSSKPSDCIKILTIGRLVPAKGYHILIASMEILKNLGYCFSLDIVGGGPLQRSLEEEIDKRSLNSFVTLSGIKTDDAILKSYREADIFVLSSFAEGIPVVLMEAMSMEIPCVATHITGIPELIQHNVEGLLVIPASDCDLATQLGRLMSDQKLRKQMGSAARKKIIESYNLPRNIEHLAKIFKKEVMNP